MFTAVNILAGGILSTKVHNCELLIWARPDKTCLSVTDLRVKGLLV